MKMRRRELEAMLAHARGGYPLEVCGVLLGREGEVERALPLVNREVDSPRVRYQIAPEDLVRVQREGRESGLEILGYYHSHPDHPSQPSETDRSIAAQGLSDGVVHIVVGVEEGKRTKPTAWIFSDATQAFDEEPFEVD